MVSPVLANRGFNQARLELSGLPQRLGFILDLLRQLREFQPQQELVHRSQSARPQRCDLGHHVGQ